MRCWRKTIPAANVMLHTFRCPDAEAAIDRLRPRTLMSNGPRKDANTMRFTRSVLAVIALITSGAPVDAHHSFAAEFDVNKPVTLRGTLTKMEWVNPHGWIHIDVLGPDGKVVNWSIEAGAPNALLKRGLRSTDFPIGSEVVIEG